MQEIVDARGGSQRKLFGTDGVRGVANVEPMTSETGLKLGRALAHVFRNGPHRHKVIIGKDTRISGYMFETALASGICSMGVDVMLVGPLPTPGIAFLTRNMRADAGVVISASHNPFQDNGIKFFARTGFKLPDEVEEEMERLIFNREIDHLRPTAAEIGKAFRIGDARGRYIVFLKNSFPKQLTLDGLKIAVDCAHGAAYRVAPETLEELGAQVFPLGVKPNGANINQNCGALFPETVQEEVTRKGLDLGVGLDGDGDRAILVDNEGRIVDGDETLLLLARQMIARGELPKNTVVATVMSNYGLELALEQCGGRVVRTAVGDRYVVEEMVRGGYSLGGEQSGHIVMLDHSTTGDGILTLLQVLAIVVQSGKSLADLTRGFYRFPQVLVNVDVSEKKPLECIPGLQARISAAERELKGKGRVLIRYSGTEALARIMVEGEDEKRSRGIAEEIAEIFHRSCRG